MDDMLKSFVVEARELATNVEEHLLGLERRPDDMETLNAVFRSFHTIKGGAGFMNLGAMVSACHLTENLFDALRTGKAPVTPLAIEAALQASGFVADQLTELHNGTAPDRLPAMPDALEKILTDAIEGRTEHLKVAPAAAAAVAANRPTGGPDWDALYRAVVPPDAYAATPGTTLAAAKPTEDGWDGKDSRTVNPESKVAPPLKEDSIRVDAVKLDVLLE